MDTKSTHHKSTLNPDLPYKRSVVYLILYQRSLVTRPVVLLSTKTGRQVAPDRQMAPPTSPAHFAQTRANSRKLAQTRANSRKLAQTHANSRKLAQTCIYSHRLAQTRTNLRK